MMSRVLSDLSVVIPVRDPPDLPQFIREMEWLLFRSSLIVVDSGGGELLRGYTTVYVSADMAMGEARKLGILVVKTPFTLNLDVDAVISPSYLEAALEILRNNLAEAVATSYESFSHHYGFAGSLWKTDWLQRLYNYSTRAASGVCECDHMWARLAEAGGRLKKLPKRAKHLRTGSPTLNLKLHPQQNKF